MRLRWYKVSTNSKCFSSVSAFLFSLWKQSTVKVNTSMYTYIYRNIEHCRNIKSKQSTRMQQHLTRSTLITCVSYSKESTPVESQCRVVKCPQTFLPLHQQEIQFLSLEESLQWVGELCWKEMECPGYDQQEIQIHYLLTCCE